MMGGVQDSVGGQVPHLRVSIIQILLHSEIRLLWAIMPVLHLLELFQRLGHRSIPVDTRAPGAGFDTFSKEAAICSDLLLCG